MATSLHCPNCGGAHTVVNPGITMLVCDYCQAALYWDEDAVVNVGKKSVLPKADTRLHMGAMGSFRGKDFRVIGHVRYDHGRGIWDEWYIELADMETAWLSEDERSLTLERPVDPGNPVNVQNLQLGSSIDIAGQFFTVRERGNARCVGGEGQLPFTVLPDSTYPYVDIASVDGKHFGTIEVDNSSKVHCFIGQTLSHEDLKIEDEVEPVGVEQASAKGIECTNCRAPLERPGQTDAQTLVCQFCGAQLDLKGADAVVMGYSPKDYDTNFIVEIGHKAKFEGENYEVCGRMIYEGGYGYQSREYLLHNPQKGYRWLEEEDGHYVLARPTKRSPNCNIFSLYSKNSVRVGDTHYTAFESGHTTLEYVDGALPWKAVTGDTHQWGVLINPPHIMSVEVDGEEIEYFHGTYMEPEQVWQAFGLEPPPPPKQGIHAAQPFARKKIDTVSTIIMLSFLIINVLAFFWSMNQKGKSIFDESFVPTAVMSETLSGPFNIEGSGLLEANLYTAGGTDLDLSVALLNSQNKVVSQFTEDISPYNNSSARVLFKPPAPGQYRFIVRGYSSKPDSISSIRVIVKKGVFLSRYFFILALILAIIVYKKLRVKSAFEKKRWHDVEFNLSQKANVEKKIEHDDWDDE